MGTDRVALPVGSSGLWLRNVEFDLSVDEFVASDVDDLPSEQLRDLWLMDKGALAPGSGVAGRS